MKKKRFTLSIDQIRQIARYEITFKDIIDVDLEDGFEIAGPEGYVFSLDDLHQAIRALKEKDPSIIDFSEYWYDLISGFKELFGLDRDCGAEEDFEDVLEEMKEYPGLLVSDSDYFSYLWHELGTVWENHEGEDPLSEALDLDEILAVFDRYRANAGKPIGEWVFSEKEMNAFILFFNDEQFLANADESMLMLARRFIDQLCEHADDPAPALYTKGYACYGGNRLYPCDWSISRDCMLRLFDMDDDPQYANTLGYIYYYGRCNGGVPEYENAFRFFEFAAHNGAHESLYKLGDMYRYGYGCRQSKRTARSLYQLVYDDSLKQFVAGNHSKFADAALRMGDVYAEGIGEEINYMLAYFFYIQADYAIKLRMKESDDYGDDTVARRIQKALEETREHIPDSFFAEFGEYDQPYEFAVLASENNRCTLTRMTDVKGRCVLIAERIPTKSVPDPGCILLTFPEMDYCEHTMEVSMVTDDDAKIWFKDDAKQIRYDFCGQNEDEDSYEFYYDDELVARIVSDHYRFYDWHKG